MNITSKDSLITSDDIANMFTSKFSEVCQIIFNFPLLCLARYSTI